MPKASSQTKTSTSTTVPGNTKTPSNQFNPTLKLDTEKHRHLPWLLLLFAILVGIAFYYLGYNNGFDRGQGSETSTVKSDDESSSIGKTENWKTYTANSYSVQFPTDWFVNSFPEDKDFSAFADDSGRISVLQGDGYLPVSISIDFGCSPIVPGRSKRSEKNIGGKEWMIFDYDPSRDGYTEGNFMGGPQPLRRYCLPLQSGKMLEVTNGAASSTSLYKNAILETMMGTISDLTSSPVIPSNWKTYSSPEDGYSFRYDPRWPIVSLRPPAKGINVGGIANFDFPSIYITKSQASFLSLDQFQQSSEQNGGRSFITFFGNDIPAVLMMSGPPQNTPAYFFSFFIGSQGYEVQLNDIDAQGAESAYRAFLSSFMVIKQ